MLIKLLERNHLRLSNLIKIYQRQCQTKCAVNQAKTIELSEDCDLIKQDPSRSMSSVSDKQLASKEPLNKSSIDESPSESLNKLSNESLNEPLDKQLSKSLNKSLNKPLDESLNKSIDESSGKLLTKSLDKKLNKLLNKPDEPPSTESPTKFPYNVTNETKEFFNYLANKAIFTKKDEETVRNCNLFFKRTRKDPNFRELIRIMKYKKAMGLPDEMSFDETARCVGEFFEHTNKGLHYFEKTGSPVYGPNLNSPIWYRACDNKLEYKYIAAELLEHKVIYDFSYDSFMNKSEKNSLVYQTLVCIGLNNRSKTPFPLMFANLDSNSYVGKRLHQFYLSITKLSKAIQITDQSYLDLLPKEKIIYLSPHAEESLIEFKPDYHYVIGGFIDVSFSKQLSYKKAQVEGVKCYKLPIDDFVSYEKTRNKLLPLPIVHQILLDKKMNFDWKYALECNLGAKRLDIEMEELDKFKKKYKDCKKHFY